MASSRRATLLALKRSARAARPDWYIDLRRAGGLAIVHLGRSGSTVLGDLLSQHPRLRYDGETHGRLLSQVARAGGQHLWPEQDLLAHLDRELRTLGPGWVGFDYLPWQVTTTGLTLDQHADALRARGFEHFVLLRRNNYLRRLVSRETAAETSVYHVRGPRQAATSTNVRLDVEATSQRPGLLERLARVDARYAEVSRVHEGDRTLTLSYERDIENDPRQAAARVLGFIGLDVPPMQVRLRKLGQAPLRERISNVDEVAEALHGTAFAWMLDD